MAPGNYASKQRPGVGSKGRIITLKTHEPRCFYVLHDGTVCVAHPPDCHDLYLSDERLSFKQAIDMHPRLLSRRERRAALRAARVRWPVMGTAPAHHPY